jgi:hypothetical protein
MIAFTSATVAATARLSAFVGRTASPRRILLRHNAVAIELVKMCPTASSWTRCYSSIGEGKSAEYLETLQTASLSSLVSPESGPKAYALPPPPPDFVSLEKGQRVVAFGDVHGDIRALRDFLVIARVMDPESTVENPIWCGGETICVQCGDVLDRGDDELACLRLLASLSRQAVEHGGSLTLLYGNHESLNAAGLFNYANTGGNAEYEREIGTLVDQSLGTNRWRLQFAGNQPSRWAATEPGGLLAEPLLANMKVAMVVGRTVFVHAGLTADHLKAYGGISGMNRDVRDWILQSHHGDNNNLGIYESIEQVIASAQNRAKLATKTMPECLGGGSGSESPVWMRDYSSPNDAIPENPKAQQMIDAALEELGHGVQRMVMGHTPQRHINAALKGKAWRVDVGASAGVMSGPPEVLEIIHGGENEQDIISVRAGHPGGSFSEKSVTARGSSVDK